MATIANTGYSPSFAEGTRVRLIDSRHRQHSQLATVNKALPNPSRQSERQWYDVRFDNGVWGRFLQRQLERVESQSGMSGHQAIVA